MDFNKQINITLKTGKTEFGCRTASTAAKQGKAKLIILASNCPEEYKNEIMRDAKNSGISTYTYDGTSMELGSVCGKPFIVAAITVREPGNSEILKLAEKEHAIPKD
ncbi:50S ribosomal protein L30e [[Eubacterium] cellulosolvens]